MCSINIVYVISFQIFKLQYFVIFYTVVLGVTGGDNYTRRSTQTSLDGSTVYVQDFSS